MLKNLFLISAIFELAVALTAIFLLRQYVLGANALGFSFLSLLVYRSNNPDYYKLGASVLALFNFFAAIAQLANLLINPSFPQLIGAVITHAILGIAFTYSRLKIKN